MKALHTWLRGSHGGCTSTTGRNSFVVLDELANRLIGEGVGLIDVSLFLGSSANLPRLGDTERPTFLTLIETGGTSGAGTHNNTATERPTVQLKAHAAETLEARALLKAAYNALGGENGLHNVTLSGIFYLKIVPRQGPTDTGQDSVGRPTYTFNVEIEKQPS